MTSLEQGLAESLEISPNPEYIYLYGETCSRGHSCLLSIVALQGRRPGCLGAKADIFTDARNLDAREQREEKNVHAGEG